MASTNVTLLDWSLMKVMYAVYWLLEYSTHWTIGITLSPTQTFSSWSHSGVGATQLQVLEADGAATVLPLGAPAGELLGLEEGTDGAVWGGLDGVVPLGDAWGVVTGTTEGDDWGSDEGAETGTSDATGAATEAATGLSGRAKKGLISLSALYVNGQVIGRATPYHGMPDYYKCHRRNLIVKLLHSRAEALNQLHWLSVQLLQKNRRFRAYQCLMTILQS